MNRRSALKKTSLFAGAAVAMPTMLALLQSCKNETRIDWQPLFFTPIEAITISTLVDMMLPRTDTPGALDVKVDVFIDKVIAETYDKEGQQNLRDEIAAFNSDCENKYGNPFHKLDQEQRIAILTSSEKSSGKFNPNIWGKTVGDQKPIGFYRAMKSMAIWAYFTSEEIGENVLNYLPVPGTYEGCKPVSEIGKRWSL